MTHAQTPAIDANGVSRLYGERLALDGFSVQVPSGSVFGLLGPNGSGKSTFIALLAGMEQPPAGSIRVFGEPPSPQLRRRIGTVFQENAQDPLMTVGETLTLAGRLFGVGTELRRKRSHDLLNRFGLLDREKDATGSLSGGMRRRLEMARALLHDPDLLLLDEPTTGVDPGERHALWDGLMVRRCSRRTILLATNDLAEADAVCDMVAFIGAGRVVATGTPAQLKAGLRREVLRVTWVAPTNAQLATVADWPGIGGVTRIGDDVRITVDDAATLVPKLFELAPGAIRAVSIERSSLEDAYFQHVGEAAGTPMTLGTAP